MLSTSIRQFFLWPIPYDLDWLANKHAKRSCPKLSDTSFQTIIFQLLSSVHLQNEIAFDQLRTIFSFALQFGTLFESYTGPSGNCPFPCGIACFFMVDKKTISLFLGTAFNNTPICISPYNHLERLKNKKTGTCNGSMTYIARWFFTTRLEVEEDRPVKISRDQWTWIDLFSECWRAQLLNPNLH